MTTRSQSVSTSASAWLDTSTACAAPSVRINAPHLGALPRVHAGRGLVEEEGGRIADQRHGEAHALARAA